MDDWQDAGLALQAVVVCFGGIALLADAFGLRGVVDPFVIGVALFTGAFALGAVVALSRDDPPGAVANVVAVAGWVLVLAGTAGGRSQTWSGIALLAVAGLTLCYRAVRDAPVGERFAT